MKRSYLEVRGVFACLCRGHKVFETHAVIDGLWFTSHRYRPNPVQLSESAGSAAERDHNPAHEKSSTAQEVT